MAVVLYILVQICEEAFLSPNILYIFLTPPGDSIITTIEQR
jgi:hypothetical protein